MRVFKFCYFVVFFMFLFLDYSNASCDKTIIDDKLVIQCDIDETTEDVVASFNTGEKELNIVPIYSNKDIYDTLKIQVINVNTDNHIFNIGSSDSPRIDLDLGKLNNKKGDQIINIDGIDSSLIPSSLYIKELSNNYGSLTINGNIKNNVVIQKGSVKDLFSLYNVKASIGSLNANDVVSNNSIITFTNEGEININKITIDEKSEIFIASNGSIKDISSMGDINFCGEDSIIHIMNLSSLGSIILDNNMEVNIEEMGENNKVLFLGNGTLKTDKLHLEEFKVDGSFKDIKIENNISVANDINLKNFYIKNAKLDLLAKNISVKENMDLQDSTLILNSNAIANKITLESSSIDSNNNLVVSDLFLEDSNVRFNNIKANNSILLKNSLLKVNTFNFNSFSENPVLNIDISNNTSIFSQGSLKTGIYSYGDVNISNNVVLSLIGSNKIKEGEPIISEIIYSKNGNINYNPNTLLLNNDKSVMLNIDYYLLQDKGTSLMVELSRRTSYCNALKELGLGCGSSDNSLKKDNFIDYTARVLDNIIKNEIPVSDNLSNLIDALDQSTAENLESNFISLKPVSNDVLLFENSKNSKFIKNLYSSNKNNKNNFSIFGLTGSTKDNIFDEKANSNLYGAYYGSSFDNIGVGFAFSKSNIKSSLYQVNDVGLTLLTSYNFNLDNINLDFLGSYSFNNYNRDKSNFNNSVGKSSSTLNNISFRVSANRDYFIEDIKVSPNLYYDVSYLNLAGYKERGEGYLYEVDPSKSFINELNVGIKIANIISDNLLLSGGLNAFYSINSTDGGLLKAYEATQEYIQIAEEYEYSGLGFLLNVELDYEINENMDIMIAYNLSGYENDSYYNGITLSLTL